MDNFGARYSSLSYLKRFQIYKLKLKLKIDPSVVRDLEVDANDQAIGSTIMRMAQALGIRTTAEGMGKPLVSWPSFVGKPVMRPRAFI